MTDAIDPAAAADAMLAASAAQAQDLPDPAAMEAAVHAYVAAFAAGDADAVAALYAKDAIVEDPVGSPAHHGREAIRAFYKMSMGTGAQLTLEGPIRVAQDTAAFPFAVHLTWEGRAQRIDVIDLFRFNTANEVIEMRAFWGPNNMTGF